MRRRRIGRLPFQRGRAPGVGIGLRPFEQAPDHVVEEQYLRGEHRQRRNADPFVRQMRRFRDERGLAQREIAPWHAKEPQIVHGQENRSEEHTSELQSLMRISYAVFSLKKKNTKKKKNNKT